ncbi:hypothetical protein BpHYR1_047137, partial [Brachionus plicatilis]
VNQQASALIEVDYQIDIIQSIAPGMTEQRNQFSNSKENECQFFTSLDNALNGFSTYLLKTDFNYLTNRHLSSYKKWHKSEFISLEKIFQTNIKVENFNYSLTELFKKVNPSVLVKSSFQLLCKLINVKPNIGGKEILSNNMFQTLISIRDLAEKNYINTIDLNSYNSNSNTSKFTNNFTQLMIPETQVDFQKNDLDVDDQIDENDNLSVQFIQDMGKLMENLKDNKVFKDIKHLIRRILVKENNIKIIDEYNEIIRNTQVDIMNLSKERLKSQILDIKNIKDSKDKLNIDEHDDLIKSLYTEISKEKEQYLNKSHEKLGHLSQDKTKLKRKLIRLKVALQIQMNKKNKHLNNRVNFNHSTQYNKLNNIHNYRPYQRQNIQHGFKFKNYQGQNFKKINYYNQNQSWQHQNRFQVNYRNNDGYSFNNFNPYKPYNFNTNLNRRYFNNFNRNQNQHNNRSLFNGISFQNMHKRSNPHQNLENSVFTFGKLNFENSFLKDIIFLLNLNSVDLGEVEIEENDQIDGNYSKNFNFSFFVEKFCDAILKDFYYILAYCCYFVMRDCYFAIEDKFALIYINLKLKNKKIKVSYRRTAFTSHRGKPQGSSEWRKPSFKPSSLK